ncbi:ribonuclease HI family protein [archaeon]|jgi:ribonuclease HI|nr:ribonuclease HI family protein [archaeon]
MIYTNSDGGSRGNPGNGAIGVLVRDEDKILEEYGKILEGKVTNNVAEYEGLIQALRVASKHTQGEITCILDSELIVKQLLGEYRVKNPALMKLFLEVQKLQNRFDKITYKHVRREDIYQKKVDYILNVKLDEKFGPRR